MTLGNWNPADGSATLAYKPDPDILARCVRFARASLWDGVPDWAATNLPTNANQMMQLDGTQWHDALLALDEQELLDLIRFFTVAEHRMPHRHGGDKSPVIWISRHLKKQGKPLSRDLVLWIKANSDNRFLPNGPIL